MSRLASFRGPSTPSKSPAQHRQASAPSSPSARPIDSPFHRKLKTLLKELQSITETWDDLVLIDGAKAAKLLVDSRTELEYVHGAASTNFGLKSAAMHFP